MSKCDVLFIFEPEPRQSTEQSLLLLVWSTVFYNVKALRHYGLRCSCAKYSYRISHQISVFFYRDDWRQCFSTLINRHMLKAAAGRWVVIQTGIIIDNKMPRVHFKSQSDLSREIRIQRSRYNPCRRTRSLDVIWARKRQLERKASWNCATELRRNPQRKSGFIYVN